MAKLSNIIEDFIKSMINSAESGIVEIQRNELASKFECAPSQINYVLTTRFTSEKGYYIESRRGGGGYIKIFKININNDSHIKNMVSNIIGSFLTASRGEDIINEFISEGVLTEREGRLMKAALNSRLLEGCDIGKELRADIFKNMMLVLADRS